MLVGGVALVVVAEYLVADGGGSAGGYFVSVVEYVESGGSASIVWFSVDEYG